MPNCHIARLYYSCAAAVISLLAASVTASAQPVYVNASASPGGNGGAWTSAFIDLQDALDLASGSGGARNEIWVAAGTYKPDRGTGNRNATFNLFAGAVLRGGFAGNELSPDARPTGGPPTILSGDIGIPDDNSDNSFHVVSMRAIFAQATIERFTVSGGRADAGGFPNNAGGGLLNEGLTTVTDCIFERNFASSGGGIYSRWAPIIVRDTLFRMNNSSNEGGAMHVRDGGTITRCTFSGNTSGFGGALSCCCGITEVSDCSFTANFGNFGGGLFNSGSTLRLSRSVFTDNSASRGGAVHSGNNAWIVNCFFGGNSGDRGGALFASAPTSIVNSVFSRNFATASGGAAWAAGSLAVSSCTVHGNHALFFGGGFYFESGASSLDNSIIYSNTDSNGSAQGAQVTRIGGTLTVNHSCIAGWNGSLGGAGNIASLPRFVDPLGPDGVPGTIDDNFRLQPTSPCIDTGNSALLPPDLADIDGNTITSESTPLDLDMLPRAVEHFFVLPNAPISNPPTDMGAYEFVPPHRVTGDANGDQRVDFTDITAVLASWGMMLVPADVDDSGTVGFSDLTLVLANWSP